MIKKLSTIILFLPFIFACHSEYESAQDSPLSAQEPAIKDSPSTEDAPGTAKNKELPFPPFHMDWGIRFGGPLSLDYFHHLKDVFSQIDSQGNHYLIYHFLEDNLILEDLQRDYLFSNPGVQTAILTKIDAQGEVIWNRIFSGNGENEILFFEIDSQDNLLLAGNFDSDVLDISNDDQLNNNGLSSSFILKINSEGNLIWKKLIGGPGNVQVKDMAITSSDDLIIGGHFDNQVIKIGFNGTVLNANGNKEVFISKINGQDGEPLWAKGLGGTGSQSLIKLLLKQDSLFLNISSDNKEIYAHPNDYQGSIFNIALFLDANSGDLINHFFADFITLKNGLHQDIWMQISFKDQLFYNNQLIYHHESEKQAKAFIRIDSDFKIIEQLIMEYSGTPELVLGSDSEKYLYFPKINNLPSLKINGHQIGLNQEIPDKNNYEQGIPPPSKIIDSQIALLVKYDQGSQKPDWHFIISGYLYSLFDCCVDKMSLLNLNFDQEGNPIILVSNDPNVIYSIGSTQLPEDHTARLVKLSKQTGQIKWIKKLSGITPALEYNFSNKTIYNNQYGRQMLKIKDRLLIPGHQSFYQLDLEGNLIFQDQFNAQMTGIFRDSHDNLIIHGRLEDQNIGAPFFWEPLSEKDYFFMKY